MRIATYLVAWDISAPERLRRVSDAVKAWKACGQKSVAECWLTAEQREMLLRQLDRMVDRDSDRLYAIRLDPRQEVMLFGTAVRPKGTYFMIV
jgi:CRISPR-associated protein Cas2